jgi:hypothetical protein
LNYSQKSTPNCIVTAQDKNGSSLSSAFSGNSSSFLRADPLTLLLLGSLTLGCWLIWDLIRNSPTLLAETLFDAEVVPPRMDLITSVKHLDWRAEAFGMTAVYFGGVAFAAATIGHTLSCLPGLQ